MVTMLELLHGHSFTEMPHQHELNLEELLKRINVLRAAWGKPFIITSGYRSIQEHKDIYRTKGIPDSKIPMGSQHLVGAACDISDPDLALTNWIKTDAAAITLVEQIGLWFEDGNTNWCHAQLFPPKSGHRFFKP